MMKGINVTKHRLMQVFLLSGLMALAAVFGFLLIHGIGKEPGFFIQWMVLPTLLSAIPIRTYFREKPARAFVFPLPVRAVIILFCSGLLLVQLFLTHFLLLPLSGTRGWSPLALLGWFHVVAACFNVVFLYRFTSPPAPGKAAEAPPAASGQI